MTEQKWMWRRSYINHVEQPLNITQNAVTSNDTFRCDFGDCDLKLLSENSGSDNKVKEG